MNFANIHLKLADTFKKKNFLKYEELNESLELFKQEVNFTLDNTHIQTSDLIIYENSDLLNLGKFFKVSFLHVFPICFYFLMYRQVNPKNPQIEAMFRFSLDFLLHICNLGNELITNISEFDYQKRLNIIPVSYTHLTLPTICSV